MKRFLFILSFVILLYACSNEEAILLEDLSTHGDLPNQLNEQGTFIVMSTDQGIYKIPVENISLTIDNIGNSPVGFGAAHYLEKFQEGKWRKIPYENFAFTDEGLGVEVGETFEQTVPLDHIGYGLTEGRYRIVKEFLLNPENKTIASEFEIQ